MITKNYNLIELISACSVRSPNSHRTQSNSILHSHLHLFSSLSFSHRCCSIPLGCTHVRCVFAPDELFLTRRLPSAQPCPQITTEHHMGFPLDAGPPSSVGPVIPSNVIKTSEHGEPFDLIKT